MSFDLAILEDAVARHGPVVRIVVTRIAGSSPREPGAAMLVWKNGQCGTIGGGALEWEAIRKAREQLQTGLVACRETLPLGPNLGQCCGGSVTLVWERFEAGSLPDTFPFARPVTATGPMPEKAARRLRLLSGRFQPVEVEGWLIEAADSPCRDLWIWGAGHVGRAIAALVAPLPDWRVTLVDIAASKFPETLPDRVIGRVEVQPVRLVPTAPVTADHIVATYSHALDLTLCHALLGHGFASAGLIGSATKWARFRSRLAALGDSPEQIARIACPIGDPSLGKHPQAIAIGVATAILRERTHQHQKDLAG